MELLTKNTRKVYLQYTIPSVLGMLAVSSASVVDGYFIGNYVGSSGVAAINLTMPIFAILFGLALMLGVGSSVIAGKLLGAGEVKKASAIFSKTCIVVGIFSVVLSLLIFYLIEPAFIEFGADGQLLQDALLYIYAFLPFIPFLMIGIIFDYFVKVDGKPNLAFIALLLSALVNIALDWLFVAYFNKGLLGAAIATGLAQVTLIITLLPHFFSIKTNITFVKVKENWFDIIKASRNGFSEFVNEASVGITALIFNFVLLHQLGVQGVAAYAIVSYMIWFSIMINFGVSDALQPIISQHFGANKIDRIKTFVKYALLTVTLTGITLAALFLIYPRVFIEFFLQSHEILTITIVEDFMKIIWPMFLFNGISLVISSYFTALHRPSPSAIIALTRSLLLPLLLVYVLPLYFGVTGIYLAIPLAEILTVILAVWFFKRTRI